jgi:putative molybdopterin biosynthesis protein
MCIMEIMSTKDLSKYLKTNEKKLYKMVQESKIPSSKIGGKIVFAREIIDKWILENTAREQQIYVAGSDDMLLRKIIDAYNGSQSGLVFYAPIGSMKGLKALKENGATMSCVHVLDTEKKEYNSSYVQRYLGSDDYVVVHLFMREQGLCVQKGNPKGIGSLEDLSVNGVTFVNRNRGCGTRLLFDFLLQEKGIDPSSIKGYSREIESHLEAGLSVLKGNADAGFCIRHAAHLLGLDFITLAHESFDMVVSKERSYSSQVRDFLNFFDQSALLHHVQDFTGYDTGRMGRVVYPRP